MEDEGREEEEEGRRGVGERRSMQRSEVKGEEGNGKTGGGQKPIEDTAAGHHNLEVNNNNTSSPLTEINHSVSDYYVHADRVIDELGDE